MSGHLAAIDWALLGERLGMATLQHITLVLSAMFLAALIAIPLGIVLSQCPWKWLVSGVLGLINIFQPIPSLALIALIMLLFYALGLAALGFWTGLAPLVIYALLPILRNTYTGIRQVDPAMVEVAKGMGMTRGQVLWRVQLPLALPFIMAGLRIAAVWTIGVATLVSLIGAGGLGDIIFPALRSMRPWGIVAGAIPAAVLALVFDWLLGRLEYWLTPLGMEQES